MFKAIFSLIIVLFALVACSMVSSPATPELSIYDMTGTAIELNATVAAENNYSTEDIYHLTATKIIFEATSGTLAAEQAMYGAIQTATADYRATQGGTPTTDPLSLTETELAFEAIMTDIQSGVDATADYRATQGGTPTPDPLYLTATQIIAEATASQIAFEVTSGTYEARATTQMMTWAAPITVTAYYWETQGVTPTVHPQLQTQQAMFARNTQTAETAVANGCEIVEHHYMVYTIEYPISDILIEESDRFYYVFDCPDPDDQPYPAIDVYVLLVVPDDADDDAIIAIVDEVLSLLLEYPPTDTTIGTDNMTITISRASGLFSPESVIGFTFTELEIAINEGLEGDALIEALGGIETVTP